MNTHNKFILTGLAGFAMAGAAYSQTVVNITGATAFRAAANTSIIALLGGAGTTEYAFDTTTGATAGASNRAIYRGTVAGITGTVIVRASWSGSTAGIAAVAAGTNVQTFKTTTTMTTAGNGFAAAQSDFETVAPAAFAFSDVAQSASTTLSPTLIGSTVGVVPFQFVANQSAHAHAGMTNMTDQIMNAIYSTSEVPLSFFTGVETDTKRVLACGRNNGSGSRATVLGETQYGFFRAVQQFQNNQTTQHNGPGQIARVDYVGNNGNSSNSFLANLMKGLSDAVDLFSPADDPNNPYETDVSCLLVTYLTQSDALLATADPDGAGPQLGGKALSYNGVFYSEDKVKNGAYTLWGYQWFYQAPSITAAETTFRNVFVGVIPANLGTAAIPETEMNITRSGGDGGPILP
ncbi:MAG: hypothetical protein ACKV19_20135 [Verrucomicrobiales bacterium]